MSTTTMPNHPALRPAHTTGKSEIAAAEREHREAKNLLSALEDRVRDGDPDIRPEELREARGLVQFTELRIEAARRLAAQLATEARAALYLETGAEARAFDRSDDALMEAAFGEALGALRNLYEIADRRQVALLDLMARTVSVVAEADHHGERGLLRAAGIGPTGQGATGGRMITIFHEDGTGNSLSNFLPYRAAFAVVGRLLTEAEATLRRQGEQYMPWFGDDVSYAANSFTLAKREFPGLETVEPKRNAKRDK